MERALRLAPYFIEHVKAVGFELHADKDVVLAQRAISWLRREKRTTFTQRELHKAIANNQNSEVIGLPLAVLERRGFIREAPKPKTPAIGRPSVVLEVNPAAHRG